MIAHYFAQNTLVVKNPFIANKHIFDQSFLVKLFKFLWLGRGSNNQNGNLRWYLPREHIWTMLMLKICKHIFLHELVVNLKIDAIYAFYPESFCDKYHAIRKVFVFSDSVVPHPQTHTFFESL